jgi:flagellar hook-length control protein FliK
VRPDAAAATIPAQVPAAGAAQLLAPAREPSPPSAMQIAEPFGSDEWSRALGDRVVVMADRDLTQARIALNPPQLGPIEVRVHVSGDQASVAFTAHSHLTREAIEQALPRLREMLGGQGFVHVDVNVSQHSFSERPQQAPAWQPPSTELPAARPAQAEAPAWRPPTARLDLYA